MSSREQFEATSRLFVLNYRSVIIAVLLTGCGAEPESDRALDHEWQVPEFTIASCATFKNSILYQPRASQVLLQADADWQSDLEAVGEDTEVLLEDGIYELTRHSISLSNNVTVRSASGNRARVHVVGAGYQVRGEGLAVSGDNVTIADITISNMRDHAVAIREGSDRTYLYNLHIYDIGTQHIKGSTGGISDGVVACSSIGYTEQGAMGDYNGGIDLHDAHNWQIAHNSLYNINGDGSGCDVDVLCGNYTSGPAILVWNGSSDVYIYNNVIIDSFRNIALGLGRGHDGGVVADNLILQSEPGDAGIELQTASNVLVQRNTVVLGGDYPGAIEFRSSSDILIRRNVVSSLPWDRGGNRSVVMYENRLSGSVRRP